MGFTFSTWIGFASAPQEARPCEERSTGPALKNDRFNSAHRDPSYNVLQLGGRSVSQERSRAGEGIGLRDTAVRVLPMCFPIGFSGKQNSMRSRLSI